MSRPSTHAGALLCAWLAAAGALPGCHWSDHDNPFDPENPDARRPRTPVVEVFAVDPSRAPPVAAALDALEGLAAREFRDGRMVLLEWRLPSTRFPGDPLALPDADARYRGYEPLPEGRALPDVFVNGGAARLQGATDVDSARARYRAALDAARDAVPAVSVTLEPRLEPSARQAGALELVVSVALLQGGSFYEAPALDVVGLVVEDRGPRAAAVVRAVPPLEGLTPRTRGEVTVLRSAPFTVDDATGPVRAVALCIDGLSPIQESLQAALEPLP